MYSSSIELTAGVYVDGDCSLDYHVCGDTVEFDWGGRRGLNVLITEDGLRNLIDTASDALTAMRTDQRDGQYG